VRLLVEVTQEVRIPIAALLHSQDAMHAAGRRAAAAAVLVAVIALQCVAIADANLELAFAVVRHGARNYLPDSSLSDDESSGGPTLLPEGQRQLYNAGGKHGRSGRRLPGGAPASLLTGWQLYAAD
jgi:hypothetical protein